MRRSRINLAAAGLTLLVILGIAISARCLSLTQVSCSTTSFWGDQSPLDVPYAGTRRVVVAKMLEMAGVGSRDHVIDLGTGDGRILIAAARDRGASGLGVDLDEGLIQRAKASATDQGVADRVTFRTANLFDTPLGEATVLTMFLLPEVNLKLRPRILSDMRPGTRVVSHAFDMGDWRADAVERVGGSRVYLWIVPAPVEGRWELKRADGGRAEVVLKQSYQQVQGTFASDGAEARAFQGQMQGARIRFPLDESGGPVMYEGVVHGDTIESLPQAQQGGVPNAGEWTARRLSSAAQPPSAN